MGPGRVETDARVQRTMAMSSAVHYTAKSAIRRFFSPIWCNAFQLSLRTLRLMQVLKLPAELRLRTAKTSSTVCVYSDTKAGSKKRSL